MQACLLDKVGNKQIRKIVFQDYSLFCCLILFQLLKSWMHLCVPIFLTYKSREMDALGQESEGHVPGRKKKENHIKKLKLLSLLERIQTYSI